MEWLKAAGVPGGWVEPEGGKGPAYEFTDPDGHPVRIYYETSKYAPPAAERPAMKSNHQRYRGAGANVRRLEHVNLMARDVRACREFWADGFGLRTFEIIRRDDGSEDGAWLSSTVQGHEVIYVRDYLRPGALGRLHHLAFWVDSREDVLRAADLMNDAGVPDRGGPVAAHPDPGLLPLHPRAGREQDRGLLRRLPRLRPRRRPGGVDGGGVRRQAGLGRPAPVDLPQLRHSPGGRTEESVTSDWPAPFPTRIG